jgi:hypothetical protein
MLGHVLSPSSPVAYFYFDYQDHSVQTPGLVLNCILRQLIEAMPAIPKPVTDLHTRLSGTKDSLPPHECERLIMEVVRESRCSYLILDALDECDDLTYRKEFLQIIDRFSHAPTFRILITSRLHTQDICQALSNYPRLTINARGEDIKTYLRQELIRGGIYELVGNQFPTKLLEKLPERADGM